MYELNGRAKASVHEGLEGRRADKVGRWDDGQTEAWKDARADSLIDSWTRALDKRTRWKAVICIHMYIYIYIYIV